ncbi:MAG: hypothetical protein AAF687_14100 [Pseudomonadota bacterium]
MLVIAPAQADEPTDAEIDEIFDRGCGDDNGKDRCDDEVQRKMRDLYGWRPAQMEVDNGVQFRRFMMVDGYGRDVLGLSFKRQPGASPSVTVSVPNPKDRRADVPVFPDTPLTAKLSEQQWQRALGITHNFDAQLASELKDDDDEEVICLHGWFTVMEAGDPKLADQQAVKVRSDAEGACKKGLAMLASFELAELAFEVLPECAELEASDFSNRVMLLKWCRHLGGDRVAAVQASKSMEELEDRIYESRKADDIDMLGGFFEYENRSKAERLEALFKDGDVYFDAPYASDSMHAVVLGIVTSKEQLPDEANAENFYDIRLELRNRGRRWTIESYEISDLKTINYDDYEN